jgi:hypothetical protein
VRNRFPPPTSLKQLEDVPLETDEKGMSTPRRKQIITYEMLHKTSAMMHGMIRRNLDPKRQIINFLCVLSLIIPSVAYTLWRGIVG